MIQDIKRVFSALTPLQRAATELREAELQLLDAYSAQEHAYATVKYNEQRVKRLRHFLGVRDDSDSTVSQRD